MAYVKLTYANRDPEIHRVAGSVRVEVDSASPFSAAFHPESLVGVEYVDGPVPESEAGSEPEAEPEPKAKKAG